MISTRLNRFADGVIEASWLAAILTTPLFFNVYSSRIFEPDKIAIIRSIALLILLAWLVKLVDHGKERWEQVSRDGSLAQQVWKTPMMPAVSLMALSYLISTIFSVSPQTSLWGSYQRLQGTYTFFSYLVIFFAVVGNLRRRAQVERLVTTIIIASLPVALYGVLQRFKLDPIPWGGNTSFRVASTLGNSIFVAAFLIMAIPLTLMRVVNSFTDILHKPAQVLRHVVRGTLYVLILALQLTTIYFSGSRGPLLGLLAGLYLMLLLLSLIWGRRWLITLIIASSLAGAVFLFVFNIPDGPFQALRESPAVGRFGTLLDTQSNTAKVRLYIWEGVVRMLSPHEPLEFPDGTTDTWNLIRPLVGYGPEGMYVAYNPFYSAELGHVERRNASPDRSHNETWDSMVMTGFLGFAAYMLLFLLIFYHAFTWLNLISTQKQKRLFWGLAGAGGLVGSVAVLLWGGIAYLGVGLPFGVAIALLVYLAVVALSGTYKIPGTEGEKAKAILIIALVSAVMAHWLEINFGIAIVATRTYFWIYTGLILVFGHFVPLYGTDQDDMSKSPDFAGLGRVASDRSIRSKRRTKGASRDSIFKIPEWMIPYLSGSLTVGMMLVVLCYDFVTNASRAVNIREILWSSFTRLPSGEGGISYGVLGLLLGSWLIGAVLWAAEVFEPASGGTWIKGFGLIIIFTFLLVLVYAVWHAGGLSAIAGSQITSVEALLQQVGRLGGLLTRLYFYIFLLMLAIGALAFFFGSQQAASTNIVSALTGLVGVIVVFVAVQSSNLQVIQADEVFKMAEPFNVESQWPVATMLYQQSIALAPSEDHYYLFLGRSYLEQAKEQTDPQQQTLLMNQAETDLRKAQRLNPLNTDHTANLARLNTWWASSTNDLTEQLKRAEKASDYYRMATKLSPNNATLWGEWATLMMEVSGDFERAKEILDHALVVDPAYNFILGLLGDYEIKLSKQSIDIEVRRQHVMNSLGYYQRAVEVSVGRDAATKVNYMLSLGYAHIELAMIDPAVVVNEYIIQAISIFDDILALRATSVREWQLNEQVSRLYLQINDPGAAQPYLQAAINSAPEDQKIRLEELYTQLYGQP